MDHLAVLREKIGRLRDEIAHLQELNDRYRRQRHNETEAQIAHGKRLERLQEIQKELVQLAGLGRRVLSVEQRKEEHRSRLHLVLVSDCLECSSFCGLVRIMARITSDGRVSNRLFACKRLF